MKPQQPLSQIEYDLIVIGSGPGGQGAAINAAKSGKRVLVVEKRGDVGGNCLHTATIPSKALRAAVRDLSSLMSKPLFRGSLRSGSIDFSELVRAAQSVIREQLKICSSYFEKNGVRVVHGHAKFQNPHEIQVGDSTFKADSFVIAVGSRPYHPPEIDFKHPRIFDSDTILTLSIPADSVTIYGAGVIGCEYTSILRTLGLKTNLINTRSKLLEFLDDEVIDALAYHLREQGVVIRHNEEYEKVEGMADGVLLHLKSGKKVKTDILLWANGRTGNADDIGLERIGLAVDNRGQIATNAFYQTKIPFVYAVGDVIGFPSLASASFDQGRIASTHWIRGQSDHLVDLIPTGIYTSPEISSVGNTERELTKKAIPYEIGHAFFKSLARAQISGQSIGMLKILFHRKTLEILGVHCFGDQASEIIHIGQAIMAQKSAGNSLMYFVNTTFNYPTMAEAYRVAALNGLNRLYRELG